MEIFCCWDISDLMTNITPLHDRDKTIVLLRTHMQHSPCNNEPVCLRLIQTQFRLQCICSLKAMRLLVLTCYQFKKPNHDTTPLSDSTIVVDKGLSSERVLT